MNKTLKQRLFPVLGSAAVMAGLLFSALPVQAVELTIVPQCARIVKKEAPSLNCALQTFANIGQLILGITGSFALLMFVYGGFTMLTSGGASEKVSQGKTILTNAVIGIVIILTSGLLIQYGLGRLKLTTPSVGNRCDSDTVANANGQGTFMQKPDGKFACITNCKTQLSTDCAKTPAAQSGKSCFATQDCDGTPDKGLCCS